MKAKGDKMRSEDGAKLGVRPAGLLILGQQRTAIVEPSLGQRMRVCLSNLPSYVAEEDFNKMQRSC